MSAAGVCDEWPLHESTVRTSSHGGAWWSMGTLVRMMFPCVMGRKAGEWVGRTSARKGAVTLLNPERPAGAIKRTCARDLFAYGQIS